MVFAYEIENYADFIMQARAEFPGEWDLIRDVIRGYSGYFERLIKGIYLRGAKAAMELQGKKKVSLDQLHEEQEEAKKRSLEGMLDNPLP
jgi:hypothetical protein